MRKKIRKGVDLVRKAAQDFELAKRYRDAREYITASILYRKATEKALKALYQQSKNREPPKNASMEYLAMQMSLPSEIYDDLVALPDEGMEMAADESLMEYDDEEQTHMARDEEYASAMSKHELVKRLLDYAKANV